MSKSKKIRLPKLPKFLQGKLNKSGATRGADDDDIYQNRVSRNGVVIILYDSYEKVKKDVLGGKFTEGYIVLINPKTYFTKNIKQILKNKKLILGENLLLFYDERKQWGGFNPKQKFNIPNSRKDPLGGKYVARIPATSAEDKINEGYSDKKMKGAGILVEEYANKDTIKNVKLQLELLFWYCYDSTKYMKEKMSCLDIKARKKYIKDACKAKKLDTSKLLTKLRLLNKNQQLICPLCFKRLSAKDFFKRLEQDMGRKVPDLTVTRINLFHLKPIKHGEYNHKPYNVGWGHHICNTVARDRGMHKALEWMKSILKRNKKL